MCARGPVDRNDYALRPPPGLSEWLDGMDPPDRRGDGVRRPADPEPRQLELQDVDQIGDRVSRLPDVPEHLGDQPCRLRFFVVFHRWFIAARSVRGY